MARYSVAAAFLFAALLMNGCNTTGTTRITYLAGQELPPLLTVSKAANFSLYAKGSDKPVWTGELGPGDEYGFVKRTDGIVYGVAKGTDITLPTSQATPYVWKQVDPHPPHDE